MSLPEAAWGDCPSCARKFLHVNCGLFKGAPNVPRFTNGSVRYLIDARHLNWREINPDIFGKPLKSRECFMVPRSAIKVAVDRLLDGNLGNTVYDPLSSQLMLNS